MIYRQTDRQTEKRRACQYFKWPLRILHTQNSSADLRHTSDALQGLSHSSFFVLEAKGVSE